MFAVPKIGTERTETKGLTHSVCPGRQIHMMTQPATKTNRSSESPLLSALATGSFHEIYRPLLLGTAVLTLALATMGNLGSSALLVGPVLALGLVIARVIIVLTDVAASALHGKPADIRHYGISSQH